MAQKQQSRAYYLQALGAILAPVIRFALRRGVEVNEVVSVLKQSSLKVAAEELQRQGSKVNVSRISAMTGLSRGEIGRLKEPASLEKREESGIMMRVINRWQQDKRFTTKNGRPRVLGSAGENSEFKQLVESVSKHLNPGTIAFELERTGTVKRTKTGLRLAQQELHLQADPEEAFRVAAQDLEALLAVASENVFEPKDPAQLHLQTAFDNISLSQLPAIRKWLIDEGKRFHKKARNFISKFDHDITKAKEGEQGGGRVHVSTFSFCAEPADLIPSDSNG